MKRAGWGNHVFVRLLALGLSCCLMSCSWLMVKSPPQDDPLDPGDCTESRLAPAFDTVLTATAALTAVFVSGQCYQRSQGGVNQDGSPKEPCATSHYLSLGWTVVFGTATGISAYGGFRDTRSCRHRRALQPMGIPVATSP